jgi:hypothetical protein
MRDFACARFCPEVRPLRDTVDLGPQVREGNCTKSLIPGWAAPRSVAMLRAAVTHNEG